MTVPQVKVTKTGPLFTGQMSRDIRDELTDVKSDLADEGERLVKQRLGERMKNPTGHYTSQLRTQTLSKDGDQLVTDGGVVYGPWLESGKYSPPRRFSGYRAWRRAATQLDKKAGTVARRAFNRLIARWNR